MPLLGWSFSKSVRKQRIKLFHKLQNALVKWLKLDKIDSVYTGTYSYQMCAKSVYWGFTTNVFFKLEQEHRKIRKWKIMKYDIQITSIIRACYIKRFLADSKWEFQWITFPNASLDKGVNWGQNGFNLQCRNKLYRKYICIFY